VRGKLASTYQIGSIFEVTGTF